MSGFQSRMGTECCCPYRTAENVLNFIPGTEEDNEELGVCFCNAKHKYLLHQSEIERMIDLHLVTVEESGSNDVNLQADDDSENVINLEQPQEMDSPASPASPDADPVELYWSDDLRDPNYVELGDPSSPEPDAEMDVEVYRDPDYVEMDNPASPDSNEGEFDRIIGRRDINYVEVGNPASPDPEPEIIENLEPEIIEVIDIADSPEPEIVEIQ